VVIVKLWHKRKKLSLEQLMRLKRPTKCSSAHKEDPELFLLGLNSSRTNQLYMTSCCTLEICPIENVSWVRIGCNSKASLKCKNFRDDSNPYFESQMILRGKKNIEEYIVNMRECRH
jgi:hypothetical protein